jgi:putative ABC transport system permease protein
MIKFLIKGLLRDRSRSLFPFLTVAVGVMLTVFMYCYLKGATLNITRATASFSTGHIKIMTKAYAQEQSQSPNDLAYIGVGGLLDDLRREYPDMFWTPRIRFGGLLDVPDEMGETRDQGTVVGMAVALLDEGSPERDILQLEQSLVKGKIPDRPGEILISDDFASRLGLEVGDEATLISSTMYGSFATANFTLAGTVRFGITAMDRAAMIADITDIQDALDMTDAAGEILGFDSLWEYIDEDAVALSQSFNARYKEDLDEFAPLMLPLSGQEDMGGMLNIFKTFSLVGLVMFIAVMSLILWNAGLIGSLRRYGEIGVRLAIGEDKGHIYRTLIMESLAIGVVGTVIGSAVGLGLSYWLQTKGLDIGFMMQNVSMMMETVLRAKITPMSFVIGFVPGLAATFIGTAIAGLGIYKRQTAHLMKELEV